MKNQTLRLGALIAGFILLSAFMVNTEVTKEEDPFSLESKDQLKTDAFEILDTKCNVCHRKQNPFMVFKPKNIENRAKKIYKMVFVERRMPKGNEVRLTDEEYSKLEKWLFTQNIF